MTTGLVLSGARAILSLDGVKVFYCTNVTYGEEISFDPIEPLDQFEVAEFVPTAYRVSFSSQHVRVVNQAIKSRGGGVSIFSRLANILSDPDLTGTVEDSFGGIASGNGPRPPGAPALPLANIQDVRATRYNINIGARGIVMTDVDFVATRITDESEVP